MKDKKQEYIKFFTHMEEEDKKCMLGGMAWDGISWWIHNAIEVDKIFTKNDLADMFPYLLGYLKEEENKCKDCIHYDICSIWSTTDLDKDEAYKYCYGNFKSASDIMEVKYGYWINTGSTQICSVCKEEQYGIDTGRYYCPNCGAKMKKI